MRNLLFGLAILLLSDTALAHETWAMARDSGDGRISVQLSHGAVFPVGDHAVRSEHLDSAVLYPEGRLEDRIELRPATPQSTYLPLTAAGEKAGWAVAAITLKSSDIELDAAEVEEYLTELGEPAALRAAWQTNGQWRERFQKHAKALVRLGATRASPAALDAGMVFEFIPLRDPTTLRPGQFLDFRLEYRDQPLANHRVGIVYANSHGEIWAQTDAAGQGRFQIAHPGWVLLRSVHITASEQPELDWESHFTTLVFEARHPELMESVED